MRALSRRGAIVAVTAVGLVLILGALWAPYVYSEVQENLLGQVPRVEPKPAVAVSGRWFDDYFVIETLDPDTFAIGEPRYYQGNYSYLLLGSERAVLFDAGSGLRDIVPVVRSLTRLPVTVIASHLHFDHVGALGRFDKTAAIDAPTLRARAHDGRLTLQRYEFMGFADRLPSPTFRVDEWWSSGSVVDLGGRRLRVLATAGHTPTSVSLYDLERHWLFAGDFIYPGHLYAFLPGASRAAYLATTRQLLTLLDPAARIYTAHMADPPAPVRAPVMEVADLKALETALVAIDQGTLRSTGFYPRSFPVRPGVTFDTGWPWNNR